jgi:hypothetical protein
MSIANPQTVFIVGAGASEPFNVPMGGEIMDMLAKQIRQEESTLFKQQESTDWEARQRIWDTQANNAVFWETPIYGAMAKDWVDRAKTEVNGVALHQGRTKLNELQRLLSNQTSETIDDFIIENPKHAEMAKCAVAALIFKACYRIDDRRFTVKAIDQRYVSRIRNGLTVTERNWIHLLINIVRHGIRQNKVSEENRVQIVTFNYDMILEYVLDAQFCNTGRDLEDWRHYIDIYHMHGAFQPLDADLATRGPAELIRKSAAGMFVVHDETPSDAVMEARELARQRILEAVDIYAAGFAFAHANCSLLGLDKIEGDRARAKTIHYCNYDGNTGLRLAVERFKQGPDKPVGRAVLVDEIKPDRQDRPLSVCDWIRGGHLGTLP